MITYDDFAKLEIRIGTIRSIVKVPETDKLFKLEVDFGNEVRQIVSGIADRVDADYLQGKQCPFITNLEPRIIRGVESNGMILAVGSEEEFALLHPHVAVKDGVAVR